MSQTFLSEQLTKNLHQLTQDLKDGHFRLQGAALEEIYRIIPEPDRNYISKELFKQKLRPRLPTSDIFKLRDEILQILQEAKDKSKVIVRSLFPLLVYLFEKNGGLPNTKNSRKKVSSKDQGFFNFLSFFLK